jgi:hypothetical protein
MLYAASVFLEELRNVHNDDRCMIMMMKVRKMDVEASICFPSSVVSGLLNGERDNVYLFTPGRCYAHLATVG